MAAKRLCCVAEAGEIVPFPLSFPDNQDVGNIILQADSPQPLFGPNTAGPTSFGNPAAGEFQIEYVSGFVTTDNFFGPPDHHYATGSTDIGAGFNVNRVDAGGNPLSTFPGYTDCIGGDFVAQTLAANPMEVFWHAGIDPVRLSYLFGMLCSNGDTDTAATGITYKLKRLRSLLPQPSRIRVKDWASVIKPLIDACSVCDNATTQVEWDGTLTVKDAFQDWGLNYWPAGTDVDLGIYPQVNINGKLTAEDGGIFFAYGLDRWELFIYCSSNVGSSYRLMWYGKKEVGQTPTGKYVQDLSYQDNGPQCSTGPECLMIESF